MTGNFNIRDNIWGSSFSHYSAFSNNLMIVIDSFNLKLLFFTYCVFIRYLDSDSRSNSVIDLMFLQNELIFIKDVLYAIKNIDILDLSNYSRLEEATNLLASRIEYTWKTNSK